MATLASTLVGTFTASMGLYDRVSDKREQHKQKVRDTKQDGEIKQLKDEFTKAQKAAEDRQKEIDRLKNGGGGGGGGTGGGYGGRGHDDVGYNLGRDAAMVQRMYDDGFGRYGSRFAQGDGMYQVPVCLRACPNDDYSNRRKPTPSANHLPPTNRHFRPPRRARTRPPTDALRPSQTHCRLQCRS
jgi:hypothetical protein